MPQHDSHLLCVKISHFLAICLLPTPLLDWLLKTQSFQHSIVYGTLEIEQYIPKVGKCLECLRHQPVESSCELHFYSSQNKIFLSPINNLPNNYVLKEELVLSNMYHTSHGGMGMPGCAGNRATHATFVFCWLHYFLII